MVHARQTRLWVCVAGFERKARGDSFQRFRNFGLSSAAAFEVAQEMSLISGPVRPDKSEEVTEGVLGAQILTVHDVRREELSYVVSWKIHIHQKFPFTSIA